MSEEKTKQEEIKSIEVFNIYDLLNKLDKLIDSLRLENEQLKKEIETAENINKINNELHKKALREQAKKIRDVMCLNIFDKENCLNAQNPNEYLETTRLCPNCEKIKEFCEGTK